MGASLCLFILKTQHTMFLSNDCVKYCPPRYLTEFLQASLRLSCFGRRSARPSHYVGMTATQNGFTLLELLTVISLIGILASVALLSYDGVQAEGRDNVTVYEMMQIRQALLRFRSDSGSRDFPGQGQYDCEEVADEAIANGRPTNWPAPPEVPTVNNGTKADWIIWCQHPANFWMLFVDPLGNGWDADRKRGWNGPYFQRRAETLNVDNTLQPEGTLNTGTISPVNNVWPILDPFNSPYLLFDLGDGNQARLVSLGSDLIYDEKDAPDCQQVLGSDSKPLDYILCLLR